MSIIVLLFIRCTIKLVLDQIEYVKVDCTFDRI